MKIERLLVIAPHCDDAELGCGGLIHKVTQGGGQVKVAIGTVARVYFAHLGRYVSTVERKLETKNAMRILGTLDIEYGVKGFDGKLNTFPMNQMVGWLDSVQASFQPDTVLIPLPSSHQDHVYMYQASVAATRIKYGAKNPCMVAAYEYPAISWGQASGEDTGRGGLYVDISHHMSAKLAAIDCYRSQMREGNHQISADGAKALAKMRGIESGFGYAELLYVMRHLIPCGPESDTVPVLAA